jgi:hypothetical protein
VPFVDIFLPEYALPWDRRILYGVFITSIDQKWQVRASVGDMSYEPIFSPDGASVAFVDFAESSAKLVRMTWYRVRGV